MEHIELEKNQLLETLLSNRGYSDTEIDHIIYHSELSIKDPMMLPNACEAAELLKQYCDDETSEIHIFADYDVDGLTSGYILNTILETYSKGYVSITFPTRQEGYGMNMDWCKKIVEHSDTLHHNVLVVTVDNGIACVEEIAYLQKHNINVVVLDHHEAKEIVPNCIIVDPHGQIKTEEYYHLAGCGVVFKVCQILSAMYNEYDMMKYTQYVALGTLADIMELTEENIAFIRYGIDIMNKAIQCNVGLYNLLDYCGLSGKVTPKELQFDIVPKLNACGRLEKIDTAYELFMATAKNDIDEAINNIIAIDDNRKELTKNAKNLIEKEFLSDGYPTDSPFIMVLPKEYAGMCGAAASKALEITNCPAAFIFTETEPGILTGSARSGYEMINLQDVLNKQLDTNNILSFGGHKMAAGLSLSNDQFASFSKSVADSVCNTFEKIMAFASYEDDQSQFYDSEILFSDIGDKLFSKYSFIPFKQDPVFKINDVYCMDAKISKNNSNNVEYHFVKDHNLQKIWVWGQPLKPIVKKKVTLYGNIEKDFRNKSKFTMRLEYIE